MPIKSTTVRFTSFPSTEPPPHFVPKVIEVFVQHERSLSTLELAKGLTSDQVLKVIGNDLRSTGFLVETGKLRTGKIPRPVFFGENGAPALNYEIDAFHPEWKCGLEVEAGRAWMGNAVYRDIVQALVMVHVDHLCLAVPNRYVYQSGGRAAKSSDYENTVKVARALYGHSRIKFPYGLTIIGY